MEKPKSFKDECIPTGIVWEGKDIEAFMVIASCENSDVDVFYHLLRRGLDLSPLASCSIARLLFFKKWSSRDDMI